MIQGYTLKLIQTLSKLRVGDPNDLNTDIKNVLHHSVREKIQRHVQDALDKGAQLEYKGGGVYHPKVLSRVTEAMLAFQEETFGPLIPIRMFHEEKEALPLVNISPYSLAGYIYSRDLSRAYRLAENLQVGVIGINDGAPSVAQVSFGGIKQPGFGREGGPSGIRESLVDKCLSINVS